MEKYDFSGYATRANLECSDGRIIGPDAFADQDKVKVPLVWNHKHESPFNVLGHAILERRDDGMYSYLTFNHTEQGENAKTLVEHGDVVALSIYANKLKQKGNLVTHGQIREVSLVLAGANPGAYIDDAGINHSDEVEYEAIIYSDQPVELSHADKKEEDVEEKKKMAKPEEKKSEKTVKDVFDTLNEEQKTVVYALVGQALADKEGDDEEEKEGDSKMKHNVFEGEERNENVICHADQEMILEAAKSPQVGSLQAALQIYADENDLQHDAVSSGFYQTSPTSGAGNITWLFPEYKDVRPGAPELITSDQGWIDVVLRKVHKSPISRIRTGQVDIRNIESLRARGYVKGKSKTQTGNFNLVRRTTDPQTIYVKSALHRDDIIDITDFDYVQYLYNIDRMNLNEELATAIMLGDGRSDASEDKIFPEHIRPIWTDDELYTMHHDLDIAEIRSRLQGEETSSFFGDNYVYAEGLIEQCLYARETFKGSGTPDFYMTPHMLNVMLLARDRNGRRIYGSKAELASSLNVGEIYTAEQFANKIRTDDEMNKHKLLGLIVNLADYSLGSTKGGEITHFTQFDIDFNQQKSLLETRVSGALTRVYSAIAIEEPYTE